MFSIGDQVVYGIHGVCQILELEERSIDRKKVQYYALEPLEQPGARYYVPTQNPVAVAKLRPVLTKSQLDALLASPEAAGNAWISDENQRKQRYRELINSGDRAALISMVSALHKHRKAQLEAGKKFHLSDENFLKDAEKLLSAEFSLVLNISADQVGSYIQESLGE